MKKIYFTSLVVFLFIIQKSFSQTHGNVSCEIGVPINEFYDNLKDVSGGVKFAVYFPLKKQSLLFIGGGLGFGVFGSKTQNVHQDLDVYLGSTLIDRIPIDFRVTTNNNFFNGHVSLRFKYPGKKIQPYAEARVGFNNFYTRTNVYDETYNRMFTYDQSSNQINSSTQLNSFTYSVGGEGGFIFRLGCWGINVGVAYLMGGEAKYYSKSQIQNWTVSYSGTESDWDANNVDPSTVALNSSAVPLKSPTDMLLCTAGFTFGLCDRKPHTKKPKTTSNGTSTKHTTNSNPNPPPPKTNHVKGPKPNVPVPHVNPNGNPPPQTPPPKLPGK
ncbi:MAG: hypothetical protein ABI723_03000 [Bacteroidia bacterium]